jgi:hypothetical protein
MNFWHQREGAYSLGSLKFIEYKWHLFATYTD